MSEPHPDMPKQWIKGMEPTMNDKGFMFAILDEFANEFIQLSGASEDEVLELGCAYGVATIKALEAGGRVTACDMDERHLEVLLSRVPDECRDRLTLKAGTLPDIDLPENHFGAVLCSRVIHFLRGDDIDATVRNVFRWLKPGGRFFLVADTPYGIWRNFIPTWDANIEKGERWPGLMERLLDFLPFTPSREDAGPEFMNLMSPDLLERTCKEAGFEVERAVWVRRDDFGSKGRMDGRENCGLAAIKPV
ncbi:MAG: hypothetical protein CL799_10045 [Chromatiales bacterium]|nr:hypothetical protein [Chromatiales bacterium]MDP6149668.1 methyltransferase domain-containing protein [Gammaproteobacteria bacterium]MDP7094069.1 methyltransferase domain-containing protein [Gammaproteobacteria bacterium]MDP7269722.1 methyltransferase domain-containing protein [Gammaproteobacteria bacterium]HJP05405.1 methyltransferase domain-containing protein [Gammaproteobacteria bacterium]